jgi:hypothetical protein
MAGARADVWNSVAAVEGETVFQISDQALVYDAGNRPHYFYGGSYLYHKYFDGLQWRTEIVDSAPRVGRFAGPIRFPVCEAYHANPKEPICRSTTRTMFRSLT